MSVTKLRPRHNTKELEELLSTGEGFWPTERSNWFTLKMPDFIEDFSRLIEDGHVVTLGDGTRVTQTMLKSARKRANIFSVRYCIYRWQTLPGEYPHHGRRELDDLLRKGLSYADIGMPKQVVDAYFRAAVIAHAMEFVRITASESGPSPIMRSTTYATMCSRAAW